MEVRGVTLSCRRGHEEHWWMKLRWNESREESAFKYTRPVRWSEVAPLLIVGPVGAMATLRFLSATVFFSLLQLNRWSLQKNVSEAQVVLFKVSRGPFYMIWKPTGGRCFVVFFNFIANKKRFFLTPSSLLRRWRRPPGSQEQADGRGPLQKRLQSSRPQRQVDQQ